jgi:hypothetical protein
MVHAAIFAKPDEYPGRPASVRVARIFARATRSGQQEGDQPREGGIMHPMFVQLYLEPDTDQDEQDRRRRAARARRLRSRAAVRVTTAPAHAPDRPRRR